MPKREPTPPPAPLPAPRGKKTARPPSEAPRPELRPANPLPAPKSKQVAPPPTSPVPGPKDKRATVQTEETPAPVPARKGKKPASEQPKPPPLPAPKGKNVAAQPAEPPPPPNPVPEPKGKKAAVQSPDAKRPEPVGDSDGPESCGSGDGPDRPGKKTVRRRKVVVRRLVQVAPAATITYQLAPDMLSLSGHSLPAMIASIQINLFKVELTLLPGTSHWAETPDEPRTVLRTRRDLVHALVGIVSLPFFCCKKVVQPVFRLTLAKFPFQRFLESLCHQSAAYLKDGSAPAL
jgi:hypothetical protein